jgi:hypothetical protein
MHLYPYVVEVVKSTLRDAPIINISDHLDRGELSKILRIGDIICVQGAHYFKRSSKSEGDPRKASALVRRKVRDVEIKYSIDLWDATSNSAAGVLLAGRQSKMSLVAVRTIDSSPKELVITCSGIAIGSGFEALKTREYSPFSGNRYDPDDDFGLDEDNLFEENSSG